MRQRVKYYNDVIYWFFNDKLHRDGDLPARYYFDCGKLYYVYYYQNDKRHRASGPAFINYKYKKKRYYYQGKEYASLEEMHILEVCK